jgi:hypothetical protein
MTIRAFDAGEVFAEITTIEVFANDMRDDRPIKTILLLEEIIIALLELEKVMIEKLPQRGLLRFSPFVNTSNAAAFHVISSCGEKNDCSSKISHFSYIGREIGNIVSTPFQICR